MSLVQYIRLKQQAADRARDQLRGSPAQGMETDLERWHDVFDAAFQFADQNYEEAVAAADSQGSTLVSLDSVLRDLYVGMTADYHRGLESQIAADYQRKMDSAWPHHSKAAMRP